MAYGMELRTRAVAYVRAGGSQTEASRVFQINRKTLYNWLNKKDLVPGKSSGRRAKLDKKQLAEHVKSHPEKLLRERAEHFGVSLQTIWAALRQLKIVKKNDTL